MGAVHLKISCKAVRMSNQLKQLPGDLDIDFSKFLLDSIHMEPCALPSFVLYKYHADFSSILLQLTATVKTIFKVEPPR